MYSELVAITFAALVALWPLLYPKYSIFRRNSSIAIESLKSLDDGDLLGDELIIEGIEHDETQVGLLERGDQGFRELESVLSCHTEVRKPYDSIILIYKEGKALQWQNGPRREEQAKLYVLDKDDNGHCILKHPFDAERILELRELERWVEITAKERSQYHTTFFVLCWTGTAVWTTII